MRLFKFVQSYWEYLYFALVSLFAIVITVYDKVISKKSGKRRIPEFTLLLTAALGGSLSMFATMQFIRHKTKHAKFMIGIPLIMLLQAAAVVFVSTKK